MVDFPLAVEVLQVEEVEVFQEGEAVVLEGEEVAVQEEDVEALH